jgi:HSP20 family protein
MSTLTTCNPASAAQSRRIEYITPRANLHHDGEGYTLELEMPGVAKDGVEITVEDGKLTLTGRRVEEQSFGRPVYRERSQNEYRRVFDLDPSIDADKITASMNQGLLTVRLLKSEAVKPRKITVA